MISKIIASIPLPGEKIAILPIELILPILGVLLIRTESPIRGLIYRSFLGSIAALIYAVVGAPDVALTEVLVGTLLSAILYIITIRACYTVIIIKAEDFNLSLDLKQYIDELFQELHLQVKYLNQNFSHEEINHEELMGSSTMSGSPHAVLDQYGLYIESKLLLDDLQEKINDKKHIPNFKIYTKEIHINKEVNKS